MCFTFVEKKDQNKRSSDQKKDPVYQELDEGFCFRRH